MPMIQPTHSHPETVYFSVKGQVVIPSRLRKALKIEAGTRALVFQDGDGIIIKPMNASRYDKLQGCLKGSGALKAMMEERKRERDL